MGDRLRAGRRAWRAESRGRRGATRSEHRRGEDDVVAIDLPGFGESPEPTRQASTLECADHVAAVVRGLGIASVVAVGHSMGTQVAAELVATRSDA